MKRPITFLSVCFLFIFPCYNLTAQNSMTGDGFGGRGWYSAQNYQVAFYTGYTICGDNKQLYSSPLETTCSSFTAAGC